MSRLTIPPPAAAIKVVGDDPGERGDDYEAKVLSYYGLTKLKAINVPGSINPDSRVGNFCFEIKYQDTWEKSIFNSQIGGNPGMAERKVIAQAKKYDEDCIDGVVWITNHVDFQNQYEKFFRQEGVKKFEFLIIPSTR